MSGASRFFLATFAGALPTDREGEFLQLPTPVATTDASSAADLAMAERCVFGDRSAERELIRRTRGTVHATLYRILGSNRNIEDLLQDTFIEVFRSLRTFRGEARLTTWIDRIAVRVALAHLGRRRTAEVSLELVPEMPGGDPAIERRMLAREAASRLYAALDGMEAKQRIAFALHVIDGRPAREVATLTRSTVLAVKSRTWRARREIERCARRDPVLRAFFDENPLRGEG
jgi:RNA polymerase sigma-70 factor (ECF subfamily)